jgi:hypothetical protein
MTAVLIPAEYQNPLQGKLASVWMLVSASQEFLNRPRIAALLSGQESKAGRKPLLWTDDHTSILPILR